MNWGATASSALKTATVALAASVATLWLTPRVDLRMSCINGDERTAFTARYLTVSGTAEGFRVTSALKDETGVGLGEVHALPTGAICIIDRVRRGSTQ